MRWRDVTMKRICVWAVALLLATASSASAVKTEVLTNYDGKVAEIVTRDDQGRVIQMEDPDGSSPDLHLYYDADGCLDRIVHGDGTVDEFDCDGHGNVIPRSFGQMPQNR
jgi:YD repeat-containing protein